MSLVRNIQELCSSKNTTLIGLEREIGLGRGTIRNWDNHAPSIDKLQKVANYFGVSIDFLLGQENLTKKDERDIAKRLEQLEADLASQQTLMLSGEILDDETRELLKSALEHAVKVSKLKAKKKFNPTKNQ